MIRGAGDRWSRWLGAACLLAAACEGDEPAPAVEFDPNLVYDAGGAPPRPSPVGGGGRADAGKDAASSDAAPGASDAGLDGAGTSDAEPEEAGAVQEPGALENAERLLIADGFEQRLYAYDVPSRQLLESFQVDARARISAGPGGRYGYALPSVGRDVRIVDMGFVVEQTPQGSARRLAPVAMLDARLMGAAPATLLAQAGQVAVFYDGEGKVEVLRESALSAGQGAPETLSFVTGAPQRGIALPFDGGIVATRLVNGVPVLTLYDERGTVDNSVSFDCEAPEGAALAAGVLAVGCEAGVLRVEPGGAARLLAYPLAGGAVRVRQLVGHPADALHLAALEDQLCSVGESALSCVPLAQPLLDFGFDAGGKRALALGADGTLRVLDANSLQALGMVRVTSAVTTSDPLLQPRLASGRRLTYVSDPQASSVHMVDPTGPSVAGRIELPGAPASLAVFSFRAAY